MELKLTPPGLSLMYLSIAGEASIEFTAIQLGNGADAGENTSSLSNPLLTVELSGCDVGDSFVTLTGTFSNNNISDGFRATELGVLAKDPSNKDEVLLYAYSYTPDDQADYIPSGKDRILESQMDVLVYIGNAKNVTASISESLVYASQEAFEAHVRDQSNPHHVTAEQVGLGNVQNAAPEDMTAAFTETALSSVTNITSGERFGSILQKIRTAIASLISHLSATNPHKITAAGIGAAASSHTHAATAITSGTLGVARGGTGKGSWTANRLAYPSAAATFSQLSFPTKSGMYLRQNTSGAPYWGECSETGVYTGQGRSGSSAKNSITFSGGLPKFVIVQQKSSGQGRHCVLLLNQSSTVGYSVVDGVLSDLVVSTSGNTVYWYYNSTDSHPANQLDTNGATHVYVGIF